MDTENANNKNLFSNISESTEINSENKLWYRKGTSVTSSDTDDNPVIPTPTPNIVGGNMVGDQIKCWNTSNNRGELTESSTSFKYPRGSFVYYKGFWWQKMYSNENDNYLPDVQDGKRRRWKKIDNEFDYSSYYEKGDIVTYNNVKYICKQDFLDGSYFEYGGQFYPLGTEVLGHESETPWKKWFEEYYDGYVISEDMKHNCKKYWQYNTTTVANKLNNYDLGQIETYKSTQSSYAVGSIVKIKLEGANKNDEQYYNYYLKVLPTVNNYEDKPNTSPQSGWQLLTNSYDSKSAYKQGDVVYYGKDSLEYIKAKTDLTSLTDPSNDVSNKRNWERTQ